MMLNKIANFLKGKVLSLMIAEFFLISGIYISQGRIAKELLEAKPEVKMAEGYFALFKVFSWMIKYATVPMVAGLIIVCLSEIFLRREPLQRNIYILIAVLAFLYIVISFVGYFLPFV